MRDAALISRCAERSGQHTGRGEFPLRRGAHPAEHLTSLPHPEAEPGQARPAKPSQAKPSQRGFDPTSAARGHTAPALGTATQRAPAPRLPRTSRRPAHISAPPRTSQRPAREIVEQFARGTTKRARHNNKRHPSTRPRERGRQAAAHPGTPHASQPPDAHLSASRTSQRSAHTSSNRSRNSRTIRAARQTCAAQRRRLRHNTTSPSPPLPTGAGAPGGGTPGAPAHHNRRAHLSAPRTSRRLAHTSASRAHLSVPRAK